MLPLSTYFIPGKVAETPEFRGNKDEEHGIDFLPHRHHPKMTFRINSTVSFLDTLPALNMEGACDFVQ